MENWVASEVPDFAEQGRPSLQGGFSATRGHGALSRWRNVDARHPQMSPGRQKCSMFQIQDRPIAASHEFLAFFCRSLVYPRTIQSINSAT
jgi:hypothetical protein